MKELMRFLQKESQKEYLELFMILDEIRNKYDILSFTYDKNYLIVQTGVNDYIRIKLKEVRK